MVIRCISACFSLAMVQLVRSHKLFKFKKMKILGFASKVVKCIFNTVEAYVPEIKANSFEDYEKKYSEQVVSIVKESLPFFRIENDFE